MAGEDNLVSIGSLSTERQREIQEMGRAANEALLSLITRLEEAESALIELEKTLFTADVEAALTANAAELEAAINEAKDSFFAEFEAAHAEDIAAIEEALLARKAELKAAAAE